MEELHSLSLQPFELVAKYEQVIKQDRHFYEAKELRSRITEVEAKLTTHIARLKVERVAYSEY